MRTIVDLPDKQLREVDGLCKTLGISRAEAVRRALEEFVGSHREVRADGFGLWTDGAAGADAHGR